MIQRLPVLRVASALINMLVLVLLRMTILGLGNRHFEGLENRAFSLLHYYLTILHTLRFSEKTSPLTACHCSSVYLRRPILK